VTTSTPPAPRRLLKEVVLSAQVAGEVAETHPQLNVGLSVKSHHSDLEAGEETNRYVGDLLVRIDPSSYEERVAAARHRLAEDQSELRRIEQEETNINRVYEKIVADWEDSEREYQKMVSLRMKGVTTDSDLRRAQMDLRQHEKAKVQSNNERDLLPLRREQTERRIESHTTDLKLSELELARTFVRPPFDGVLSAVQVERGQYVRVGEPLLTIMAVAEVEIPLSVTLDDYAKLLPDVLERQYPAVELAENETAKPRWTGHIVRVSPKADEQTRTATVFIRVDNTTQVTPLLPGTFVHARIDGPVLRKVQAVPRDAVLGSKAFVERGGKIEQRTIVISRMLHGLALIESGLDATDRIVLTNLDVLHEGATVSASLVRTIAEELARQRTRSAKLIEPAPTGP
jgi:RND family efflux transporter MFP subunit